MSCNPEYRVLNIGPDVAEWQALMDDIWHAESEWHLQMKLTLYTSDAIKNQEYNT